MSGTKVHTKFPHRTHSTSVVSNARKVLRSNDPGVSRESVIHALRTLYRHRELDFNDPADRRLVERKLGTNDSYTFSHAALLITLDNKQAGSTTESVVYGTVRPFHKSLPGE